MEEPDRVKVMRRAYELWEQAGCRKGVPKSSIIRLSRS